ncbi:hypothetical protein [Gordonia insulae]|uniref:Uncharacterized protein n=1 Tax=Gordonia insulae TaxID=2420509 RepID=A0A3G8JID1_9ACTN|nr:hypothetical protein [Gordonia insulae]AZG44851.1 hypothetical protein D7316_01443 [Gordonia insulae]
MSNDSTLFSHTTDTTHAAVQTSSATADLEFSDAPDESSSVRRD